SEECSSSGWSMKVWPATPEPCLSYSTKFTHTRAMRQQAICALKSPTSTISWWRGISSRGFEKAAPRQMRRSEINRRYPLNQQNEIAIQEINRDLSFASRIRDDPAARRSKLCRKSVLRAQSADSFRARPLYRSHRCETPSMPIWQDQTPRHCCRAKKHEIH